MNGLDNRKIVEIFDTMISKRVFECFLGKARNILGSEQTYRMLLVESLIDAGIQRDRIIAEYPAKCGGLIDLAILCRDGTEVEHLFEIKGGAYNVRHALHDELNYEKLEKQDFRKLRNTGSEMTKRWFIALDLSMLGGVVESEKLKEVGSLCESHDVCFVYYDFRSETAEVTLAGELTSECAIASRSPGAFMAPEQQEVLLQNEVWLGVAKGRINQHEQNAVISLCLGLRRAGIPASSISLETQFKCAPSKSRRKEGSSRPDVCVFDPSINGLFNLYAEGKRNQSRDSLKLMKLQSLIEVKNNPTEKQALEDIEKLDNWRVLLRNEADKLGIETHLLFQFVTFNTSEGVIRACEEAAFEKNVDLRII